MRFDGLSIKQLERLMRFSFKLLNRYQTRRAFVRHGLVVQALERKFK